MGKLTQGIRKIIRKEGYVNEIIPAVNEQRGTFVIGKTAYVVDSDDLVDLAKVINTIKKLKEKISSIKFHKLWCILMTALSLIVLPIGVWGIASTISQIVMTQEIFIEYITKTQMRTFQNIVYLLFIILGAITAFNIKNIHEIIKSLNIELKKKRSVMAAYKNELSGNPPEKNEEPLEEEPLEEEPLEEEPLEKEPSEIKCAYVFDRDAMDNSELTVKYCNPKRRKLIPTFRPKGK